MKIAMIAIAVALACSSASAQIVIKPKVNMAMYSACMNSAVQNNDVTDQGRYIEYLCFGSVARSWWNSLDTDDQRDVHDHKYGRFIARYYGNTGYCAHHIEDTAGNGLNSYVCSITAAAPN